LQDRTGENVEDLGFCPKGDRRRALLRRRIELIVALVEAGKQQYRHSSFLPVRERTGRRYAKQDGGGARVDRDNSQDRR
jgi:hypothetical protein